jgi:hypothetical protein
MILDATGQGKVNLYFLAFMRVSGLFHVLTKAACNGLRFDGDGHRFRHFTVRR